MDLNQLLFHHQILRMAEEGQLSGSSHRVLDARRFAELVADHRARDHLLGNLAAIHRDRVASRAQAAA